MNIPISRRVSVPGSLLREEPERWVGMYLYHISAWYRIRCVDARYNGFVLDDGSLLLLSPDEGQLLGMPEEA